MAQNFNSECNWTHQNMKQIFHHLKILNWIYVFELDREVSLEPPFIGASTRLPRIKAGWYRITVISFSIVILWGNWDPPRAEAKVWAAAITELKKSLNVHLRLNEITLHPATPVSAPMWHIHTGIAIRKAAEVPGCLSTPALELQAHSLIPISSKLRQSVWFMITTWQTGWHEMSCRAASSQMSRFQRLHPCWHTWPQH